MSEKDFKDKFIGFIDILGSKHMTKTAEAGTGMSVDKLIEMRRDLGTPKDREHFAKCGPTTCPESTYIKRDLDFQILQVSDCAIISAEVSPAGIINLVGHCWLAAMKLLTKGVMVRGYITRGSIYHEGNDLIGSGYEQAYFKEPYVTAFKRTADEQGTPFIEIAPIISIYVKDHGDSCVKEMFSRYVKEDGNDTAIFPFKRLAPSFSITGFGSPFDSQKVKESNQILRKQIKYSKCQVNNLVDTSNPDAVRKAEHYISALDALLRLCDEADAMIDRLSQPYPALRMSDIFKKS